MARVLIVDDNTTVQRVLALTLRKEGYEVLSATSGVEALELLDEHEISIIISDIAMPEMDGITFVSQVRENPRLAHLPVIMLTASGQDEDRDQAKAVGANGFLTKPASSRELVETVNDLLKQTR